MVNGLSMNDIKEYRRERLKFRLKIADLVIKYMQDILKSNSYYDKIYITETEVGIINKNGRYIEDHKTSYKNYQRINYIKELISSNKISFYLCLNGSWEHDIDSISAFKLYIKNFDLF